jgi:DNA-3-methyladenine glycosylase
VGPHDDASHAAERLGRTRRNEVMFAPPGRAYVYLIYGMHWCLNAVTDEEGFPAAVLIRAAAPVEGLPTMRGHRPGRPDAELLRGPGNLCRALGIAGADNGHDLREPPLRILGGATVPDSRVARGPRVGITRAVEHPFRFWVRDCPSVSGRT